MKFAHSDSCDDIKSQSIVIDIIFIVQRPHLRHVNKAAQANKKKMKSADVAIVLGRNVLCCYAIALLSLLPTMIGTTYERAEASVSHLA